MVLPKILVVILSCCSALGSKRTTQNFGKVFSSGEGEITTLTKACCTEDFIAHIHFEAAAPPEKFAIILPPSKVLPIKEKFLKRNSDKRFKAEIDLAQMTNVTEPTEIFLQIGGAEKIRLRRCRSKRSSFDYHCSVRRDDFCRCNLNSRLCCTSDPKHQGPFSCQECIDRNEDNCDFCDQNGRKCMTFEKSQNYAAGNITARGSFLQISTNIYFQTISLKIFLIALVLYLKFHLGHLLHTRCQKLIL